jgi:glycosyltransferase involved in cell wall biosynthesis
LHAAVDELDLAAVVRIRGWLDAGSVTALLGECDVLLIPSNREGMPVVMMEALAAGCAVVASRVSGVEDVEQDASAKTALFVHAIGDVDAAASCVTRALAVPHTERRVSCRRTAEALFSIEACAAAYREGCAGLDRSRLRRSEAAGFAWLHSALSVPLAAARAMRRSVRSDRK